MLAVIPPLLDVIPAPCVIPAKAGIHNPSYIYTVNGHNWSFFIMVFSPREHKEHKEIIKALLLIPACSRQVRASSCPCLVPMLQRGNP